MPTSLVSTGVQFPDSTIQTTAATGSPSFTTAGTTLAFVASESTNFAPAQLSTRGAIYGTNNPLTTDFVRTSPIIPEQQISMAVQGNQGSGGVYNYPSLYTRSAYAAVGGNTDYVQRDYLVYDGYTGRYTMNLSANIGGVSDLLCGTAYTTDFVNWTPYLNSNPGLAITRYPSAFNPYTGTRVYTSVYSSTFSYYIYRVTAANAYNQTATPTNSIYCDNLLSSYGYSNFRCHQVRFVDTGSSGSSYFLASIANGSNNNFICKSTDDGVNWTAYIVSGNNSPGRIVGNNTELLFYTYNQSMLYSTNGGTSWPTFNYGSNTQGTSSQYYPTQTAWNGSYWLTLYDGRANFKAMGSGTSFTTLTNFPAGVSSTGWYGLAWNNTFGCWLLVDSTGLLYSNTNSNPSSGTWAFQRQIGGGVSGTWGRIHLYVVGQPLYNF